MINHAGLKMTTHDNSDMIIGSLANYNVIMALASLVRLSH